MTSASAVSLDDRVLLIAPTRRDAATAASLLTSAGIAVHDCGSFDAALQEFRRGAALLIVPEEMLAAANNRRLAAALRRQEAWSDLPILVLTHAGAASVASREAVRRLGNVALLERPLRVTTLLSAVRTALRARQRQYQIRSHMAESRRAEERLRIADRRKDEFLATLGHELRTPLAPLQSAVQLMRLNGQPDDASRQALGIMERQVSLLVRLVDDLLEISRITRGLIEVRHDTLDLVSLVRSAIDISRPVLEAAQHDLQVDLPDRPIAIRGDAVRLTQVFANLLTNAAKYSHAGGRVRVGVRRDGDSAIVSVRDNGIGIAADHLRAVFDMFMQVDRSSRQAQGGLGIGLTLVHSLVTLHGGTVEARSEGIGKGSEFVVELPALDDSLTGTEVSPVLRSLPPCQVLIVDDNQDATDSLAALLAALGADVRTANSGRAALACLETYAADVVLLDIGMPDMDGYEVARRIRQQPALDKTLLIALTGWGQDPDHRQSRAAGFDHHMVKPLDVDRLRVLLTNIPPVAVAQASTDPAPPL